MPTDGIVIGALGIVNGFLLFLLLYVATGGKLRLELVLPPINVQLSPVKVQAKPSGYIVSRKVKGIPRVEINRFTRSYAPQGWHVSMVEWSGNDDVDVILSRWEELEPQVW